MPFRRRRMGTMKSAARKTIKMPKIKVPKIKSSDLVKIYKRLITPSASDRISALAEATIWYDSAIPTALAKKPLDADDEKRFSRANKARELGRGGATEPEQQAGYVTCLRTYEAIFKTRIQSLPSVDPYIKKYEDHKAQLELKETLMKQRYSMVLGALNQAFQPIGVEFSVHKADPEDGPRQVVPPEDGQKNNIKILLSLELARVLRAKAREQGMLPVIFSEVATALKASGLERNEDGDFIMNYPKVVNNMGAVLEATISYCVSIPRMKLLKTAVPIGNLQAEAPARAARQPKAPRAPRQPGTGRVGGKRPVDFPFNPQSGIGQAFNLAMQGTTWKDLDAFLVSVGTTTPNRIHRHILDQQFRGFKWDFEEDQATGKIKITNMRKVV